MMKVLAMREMQVKTRLLLYTSLEIMGQERQKSLANQHLICNLLIFNGLFACLNFIRFKKVVINLLVTDLLHK